MHQPTVRVMLAEYMDRKADWRDLKAAEYPLDQRNENSAAALRGLAGWITELPDDDAGLATLCRLYDGLDWISGGEESGRLVSRFGFDYREPDGREFFDAFVAAQVKEFAEVNAA